MKVIAYFAFFCFYIWNCDCLPDSCAGLTTISSPTLKGNQVVISENFKKDVEHLINCAEKYNLKSNVESTGRSEPPPDPNAVVAYKSDHQIGQALDTNLELPNGSGCNRECMGKGYCAFNMNTIPCKKAYGNMVLPQNVNNKMINDFFKCAEKDGIRLGATFIKPGGDWNHFERGKATKSAKTNFQKLLTKYCNQQCPNLPKKSPGIYACKGIKPTPPTPSVPLFSPPTPVLSITKQCCTLSDTNDPNIKCLGAYACCVCCQIIMCETYKNEICGCQPGFCDGTDGGC